MLLSLERRIAEVTSRLRFVVLPGQRLASADRDPVPDVDRADGHQQANDLALVDPSTHAVIARQRFTRSAPAPTYDADGAVAGLRQALGAVVDDVARWVEREVSAGR
jgi:hypothetical protein